MNMMVMNAAMTTGAVIVTHTRGNFWGELIAELRSEQKISQRQLAERAKVNRSTLRRIEEGRARGDIDIMERLLNYLGYDLEAITASSRQDLLKKRAEAAKDPAEKSRLAADRLLALSMLR
jgi:transcriptional regulator with XRE-family HTH domain